MAGYRLLNYLGAEGEPRAGVLVGEGVLDIEAALSAAGRAGALRNPTSTLSLLEQWDAANPVLKAMAEEFTTSPQKYAAAARPLSEVRLLAPLLYPGAIFCAAANYTDHMKEMSGREPPDKSKTRPYFFLKATRHAIIGPEDPIRLPPHASQIDWEAEIGVVIGKPCFDISEDEAMDYVAGYTILNDLSARDMNKRDDWNFGTDWFRGKSFDTSAPMGPWITPAEDVPDPYNVGIKLWVNDTLFQDSSSRFMHFNIPEQIAYLSEHITLLPGDVISTGSPAGNGRPRGIYLKPGDEISITMEGLGSMHNPVVAAKERQTAASGRA